MLSSDLAQRIAQALRDLTYGSIQLVVHDAQVVRIERIERTRLTVFPEAIPDAGGQPTDASEVCHDG